MKTVFEKLKEQGYIANNRICSAVKIAELTGKPLLIEGFPGVGKTSLAKAYADAYGYPFIRVQLYDGLTDDKILYDYDYQKQLLTLEAIRPQMERDFGNLSAEEAMHEVVKSLNFYGEEFLIKRPVLRAITGKTHSVLLLDEIDKAPEEIEYMLYEVLENYSVTIPQYGTISATEENRPIVFITSNNYRDISEPFKRRCAYLYIEKKTEKEIIEILQTRANTDDKLAEGLAKCFTAINEHAMKKTPSIAELVDFAAYIGHENGRTKEFVVNSLSLLVKDNRDETVMRSIIDEYGGDLWE